VLEHPAYSLDLDPSDFFLFPKIKEILKGRHFYDIDDIRNNTRAALKAIPQNQFQNFFDGWTRNILTEDLDMRKMCAKMFPKELTEEQKLIRRVFSYL